MGGAVGAGHHVGQHPRPPVGAGAGRRRRSTVDGVDVGHRRAGAGAVERTYRGRCSPSGPAAARPGPPSPAVASGTRLVVRPRRASGTGQGTVRNASVRRRSGVDGNEVPPTDGRQRTRTGSGDRSRRGSDRREIVDGDGSGSWGSRVRRGGHMGVIQRTVAPVAAVAHAARRPATYAGHLKELTSTIVTGGRVPVRLPRPRLRGRSPVRRLAGRRPRSCWSTATAPTSRTGCSSSATCSRPGSSGSTRSTTTR